MPASSSIKKIIFFYVWLMCTFKSSLSTRRKTEMPLGRRLDGCSPQTGAAVATWLPERGGCAGSVLGRGPPCADSPRTDRERVAPLGAQG